MNAFPELFVFTSSTACKECSSSFVLFFPKPQYDSYLMRSLRFSVLILLKLSKVSHVYSLFIKYVQT